LGYDDGLRSLGPAPRAVVLTPWARAEGTIVVDLDVALATVRDRIAKYQRQSIGEQDTKAALIVPVLRALGWDTEDLEDVKLEYKRLASDNPVDYALFLLREPRLFIEAKALGVHVDDHKWTSQILAYATVAGVEWVVLTDGNEWRIYNSHATVPVERKLFRVVRVADPDTRPGETLRLLAKGQMADHLIDVLWKSDFVDRQIKDALVGLFGPEPDSGLVRLIRGKAESLSPAEIRSSLGRLRTTFDFPVASLPTVGPVLAKETKPVEGESVPVQPPATGKMGEGTPWRGVSLGQLISSGIMRLPFEIEHNFRGTNVSARIEAADRIVFAGAVCDSLSMAGGMARTSVSGPYPGRDYPQTNGWTFWEYRSPDGTRHPLDDLRRELYEGKVVNLADGRRAG
jgi:Type I restriction enzyme R protein N terminus (HSDR_N)